MRLYDTATRSVRPLTLGRQVGMYVCGITPYDAAHAGHAATFLTYDLLQRRLEDLGHDVTMVRNVTDVDDSILPRARQLGADYADLAAQEMKKFRDHMLALAIRPPTKEPFATAHIDDILDLIGRLRGRGHTYDLDGTTYFDVSRASSFGTLSGYPRKLLEGFFRSRGGDPDRPGKRNSLDFVLWQPSADWEPSWPSPFGSGRPGWHIECSAMSMVALGTTIDIHGGGTDLIFPHHECERVQSESATGAPFVKHWVHAAVLNLGGDKMSKSLGNLVFVGELLEEYEPVVVRAALMGQHYRRGYEWDQGDLAHAQERVARLRSAVASRTGADSRPFEQRVRDALDDDLDAPSALRVLDELAASVHADGPHADAGAAIMRIAALLGLDL
jgi:L-cysteine:1D-myo-inositol 2-amino-2-deoxy-alpha-D-glucopyranoside ligase